MTRRLCVSLILLSLFLLTGCWEIYWESSYTPEPYYTEEAPVITEDVWEDGKNWDDENDENDENDANDESDKNEENNRETVDVEPEVLAYYRLAADMAEAYRAGDPVVVDTSGQSMVLDVVLAYINMIIPRQIKLSEQREWVDDVLTSVTYECLFPLSIDADFDRAVSILEDAADALVTPGMTDREKLLAIHDWVVGKNIYPDQYDDDARSAAALAFYGNAICSGYADAVKIMCDYIGLPCVNLHGNAINSLGSQGDHGWNAVYVEGEWRHLDATFDDPKTNTGENLCLYDYFLVPTDEILRNHTFDKTLSWEEQQSFANWYFFSQGELP